MKVAAFMGSPLGRGGRVVFGAVLIYVGLNVIQGVGGTIVALLGIVPITAGLLNLCLIGPLLGVPIKGASGPAPKG